MTLNEAYSLDGAIKSFAFENEFTKITNKVCYNLGNIPQAYSIYANDKQKESKVVDFATFLGIVNRTDLLVKEIAQYRAPLLPGADERFLFLDYLLSVSICYIEIPKYVTKQGIASHTYDKFLCTRNPALIATWMGTSTQDICDKYANKLMLEPINIQQKELKLIKLNITGKGNTITVPRKTLDLNQTITCIPLYMINAFIEGLKLQLNTNLLEFKYLKDNNTVRTLVSTLNQDVMKQVYSTEMIAKMLGNIDVGSSQQGGLLLPAKIGRGYIKIPEIGSSTYDETGVRSLNLIRLLSVRPITLNDVDLSCVHVDLEKVADKFKAGIDYNMLKQPDEIVNIYRTVTGDTTEIQGIVNTAALAEKTKAYIDNHITILSTEYLKALHNIMENNPQWFGQHLELEGITTVQSSANFGVMEEAPF